VHCSLDKLFPLFLYGLSTLQTYIYFVKYPRDGVELKTWVSFIWAVDTANIALICHGIYLQTLGRLPEADPEGIKLAQGERSFDISTGFNVVIAIAVQCFFVKRIFQLSPERYKYWLLALLSTLVVAHFGLGSDAVVKVIKALDSQKQLGSLTLSAVFPYTLAAVLSDVCIAIALIVHLRSRRSEFQVMNSFISKAITFVMTRCLLVSFAAICRLIVFATMPSKLWFVAMDFTMGKLYANSLLAMLNSRRPSSAPGHTSTTLDPECAVFTTAMHLSTMDSSRADLESSTSSSSAPRSTRHRPPEHIKLEPLSPAVDKTGLSNESVHFLPTLTING